MWSYSDTSGWGGQSASLGVTFLHVVVPLLLGDVDSTGIPDVVAGNTTNLTALAGRTDDRSSEVATLTCIFLVILLIAIVAKLFVAILLDSYNKVLANAEARATYNRAGLNILAQIDATFVPGGKIGATTDPWLHVLERTSTANARAKAFQANGGANFAGVSEAAGGAELERKMPTDPSAVPSHLKPTFAAANGWSGTSQALQRGVDKAAKGHLLESARLLGDVVPPPFDGDGVARDRQMYDRLMRVLKEQENIIKAAYDERQ